MASFTAVSRSVETAGKWIETKWDRFRSKPTPAHGLRDECIDEANSLEEEFIAMRGAELDSEYVRLREQRQQQYETACADPTANAETKARLRREFDADRRRHFGEMLHRLGIKRSALCLSGGGIRSATFSLGVLQGLASRGLLGQFEYLSSVSGGGYVAGWLSAWIQRHPRGLEGVQADLGRGEPPPVFRLREYSRFLAPKFGMLTPDTWTLFGTYTRNLLVTWLALLPAIAAVLMVPRLLVSILATSDVGWLERVASLTRADSLERVLLATAYTGLVLLWWAIMAMAVSLPDVARTRRVLVATEGQFVMRCLLPLAVGAFMLVFTWKFLDRHPAIGGTRLATFAPWLTGTNWTDWLVLGTALHVFALLPELLRRTIGEVRTVSMARSEALMPPSLGLGRASRVMGIGRVVGELGSRLAEEVWPTLRRTSYAVVICGGLGGLVMCAMARLYSELRFAPVAEAPVFVVLAPALLCAGVLVSGTVYLAAISPSSTDHEREWYARAGAWILLLSVGWLAASSIAIFGPLVLGALASNKALLSAASVLSLAVTALGAARSVERSQSTLQAKEPRGWAAVRAHGLRFAAPVVLALILSLVSLGNTVLLRRVWPAPAVQQETTVYAFGMPWADTGGHLRSLNETAVGQVLAVLMFLVVVGWLVDLVTDLGVFSLHAMYRDRLIRAYLASSRLRRHPNHFTGFDSNDNLPLRHLRPSLFSLRDACGLAAIVRKGFHLPQWSRPAAVRRKMSEKAADQGEDVQRIVMDLLAEEDLEIMVRVRQSNESDIPDPDVEVRLVNCWNAVLLHHSLCELSDANIARDPVGVNRRFLDQQPWFKGHLDPAPGCRLFHLINATLNLVRGDDLHRKAAPFVFSSLHAGSASLGFSRLDWHDGQTVKHYAGINGITLGSAITVSGAAANPNMGLDSSPATTFLLALFNARLGMWLPNPVRRLVAYRRSPRHTLPYLFREAFTLTSGQTDFVNLSDGGHFENLGLYEVIKRRCHFVLVVDASQDRNGQFEDLGNAISKVRVDLGIPIDFKSDLPNRPGTLHKSMLARSAHGAVGRIKYSEVDEGAEDGWLLYIKPAIDGSEPADLLAYKQRRPQFPHEPTTNQFFGEMQFESYRMLGLHSIEVVAGRANTLSKLSTAFAKHHKSALRRVATPPNPK